MLHSLPWDILLVLFLIEIFSLGTMSIRLCVCKLVSARNQSLSDRQSGLSMLRLMEPHVLRSNIFISLVEQLFQLSHPPELETEVCFHWPSASLPLCCSHLLGWDSSPLSAAFSTTAKIVLSPVGCQQPVVASELGQGCAAPFAYIQIALKFKKIRREGEPKSKPNPHDLQWRKVMLPVINALVKISSILLLFTRVAVRLRICYLSVQK